jgi:hypothetical protein
MDRYAFRLLVVLAAATLHGWLGGIGIPRRYHVLSVVAGIIAIDGLSVHFTFGLKDAMDPFAQAIAASPYRLPILEYLLLGVAGAAMLLIVFIESSASQLTKLMAGTRALPLSDRFLTTARSLPSAMALAVLGAGAMPPLVALVVLFGGIDVGRAALALTSATAAGAMWGLLVIALLRALQRAEGRGLPVTVRYPIAVCAWAAVVGLQAWWLQSFAASGTTVIDWVLVWPAAAKSLYQPELIALFSAALIASTGLVASATFYLVSPEPDSRVLLRSVGVRWEAAGPLPLLRLELLRLWRTGRVRSVVAVNVILGLLGCGFVVAVPTASRQGAATFAVISLAVLWMALPMMARGVGRWHVPIQLQLGVSPWRWGWTVAVAGFLWGGVTAVPCLLLLSALMADASLLATGAGIAVFAFGLGALFGFIFAAGGENTVGEVVGMIVCGAALFASLWAAGQALHSIVTAAAVLGVIGALLLPATGVVEMARWRIDIGSSRG